MISGNLNAVGTKHHLKTRYGHGYFIRFHASKIHQLLPKLGKHSRESFIVNKMPNICNTLGVIFDCELLLSKLETECSSMDNSEFIEWCTEELIVHDIHSYLMNIFPVIVIVKRNGLYIEIHIANIDVSVGVIFEILQQLKSENRIHQYSVQKSNLQNVYNSIVTQHSLS